ADLHLLVDAPRPEPRGARALDADRRGHGGLGPGTQSRNPGTEPHIARGLVPRRRRDGTDPGRNSMRIPALSLLLFAVAVPPAPAADAPPPAPKLSGELNFYNFAEYIDPQILTD